MKNYENITFKNINSIFEYIIYNYTSYIFEILIYFIK